MNGIIILRRQLGNHPGGYYHSQWRLSMIMSDNEYSPYEVMKERVRGITKKPSAFWVTTLKERKKKNPPPSLLKNADTPFRKYNASSIGGTGDEGRDFANTYTRTSSRTCWTNEWLWHPDGIRSSGTRVPTRDRKWQREGWPSGRDSRIQRPYSIPKSP